MSFLTIFYCSWSFALALFIASAARGGAMKSMFSHAQQLMGNVVESKPVVAGTTFVFVWYEKSKHRVFMDVGATVAAFEMHVYLATGVLPPRQKIVGFDGACSDHSATPCICTSFRSDFQSLQAALAQLPRCSPTAIFLFCGSRRAWSSD